MKLLNTWKLLSKIVCLSAVMVSAEGCIYDNLDGCVTDYTLVVRAYERDSISSSQAVGDVRLFVFDSTRYFIQSIDTRIGERVILNVPLFQEIHIVVWGNLGGGKQDCTVPSVGESEENCFVKLLPDTLLASCAISPDELFRGEITTRVLQGSNEFEIPIYRETGSMTITVRNLISLTRNNDDDYWAMVRDTYSAIVFNGMMTGERMGYRPSGSITMNSGKEEFIVAPFNLLPENGVFIDIYHGSELITSVSTDSSNRPIVVEKGLLTNVLIDLAASVSVSVSLSDWGKVEGWKEF